MSGELARKIVDAKSTKRDTKFLIYDHALRLFATRSYARTGLRDIAEAVGVEVASLYAHIQGKNALLFDLMDYGNRDLHQRLTTAIERAPATPLARLFVLMREHVTANCVNRHLTLVNFNELRELKPEQLRRIVPLRDEIEQLYVGNLEHAIREGHVRDVNVRVAVYGMISMGRGAATWFREDGPLTAEEVGIAYADQGLRGLLSQRALAQLSDAPLTLEQVVGLT